MEVRVCSGAAVGSEDVLFPSQQPARVEHFRNGILPVIPVLEELAAV